MVDYIWSFLENNDLPILLYGTGDGADKLLKVLDEKNLKCEAIIVSDDFYRGQSFKGYKCLKISMAEEIYKDFICLLAFGTRLPNVIENINKIEKNHTVLMPSTPLFGFENFDLEFFENNKEKIEFVKSLFDDEKSKETIDDIIKFRLTGKLEYLYACMEDSNMFDYLKYDYEAYTDLGAYRGDTLKEAIEKYKDLNDIICFEPAKNPYKKLQEYACSLDEKYNITLINEGAYNEIKDVPFLDGGGRGSHINSENVQSKSGAKSTFIKMNTLDNVSELNNKKLLIKYDVEGAEIEALEGSYNTIKNNKTDLIISLYHKCSDIFDIPIYVKNKFPNANMKLRKLYGIPDWDVLLFVET